jgi:hypothetical protein
MTADVMGIAIHNYPRSFSGHHNASVWKRFIGWCDKQQDNSLGWLAASFLVHGCIFVPMTITVIAMSGNNFVFVALALFSMIIAVVVNLATLPTKISLPVFFSTLLLDILLIALCLLHGVDVNNMFRR